MKAIVVTDQAAGTAGMKLVERPEPQPLRADRDRAQRHPRVGDGADRLLAFGAHGPGLRREEDLATGSLDPLDVIRLDAMAADGARPIIQTTPGVASPMMVSATVAGDASSSAITSNSLGPAGMSIAGPPESALA